MRLDRDRLRRILTACSCALLAAGCGKDDRVVGGTNGTEAENALAFVLRNPDGSPAAGARVVVRPSEAIDSTSSGRWLQQVADSNGRVSLQIPSGQWTLEARLGRLAVHVRLPATQRVGVDTILRESHPISGVIVGVDSGTRVCLPGLALSVPVDADGAFRFPDVSSGSQLFQVRDVGWAMTDSVSTGAVTILGDQLRRYPANAISTAPSTVPVRIRLPDSLVPGQASFLDASGTWVPTATGNVRDGFRQIWIGASTRRIVALARKPDAAASPFADAAGLRMAWIPELGPGDRTGNASTFSIDSSAAHDTDAVEGPFVRANLGLSLGSFSANALPDTGAFTIALRTKTLNASIGSLWLVDWTDSVQNGIRIGIGAGRLRVVAGSLDTTVALADAGIWTSHAVRWNGSVLSVWTDGTKRIEVSTTFPADRRAWTRRGIGNGGAMAMSQLLAWSIAVDAAVASAPPLARP